MEDLIDLKDDDLNQVIENKDLEEISRSCCEEWKSLPSYLNLENIVAKDINKKQQDERAKRRDFLVEWKEKKASGATYKQLINALMSIKCKQEAETVWAIMNKSQTKSKQNSAELKPNCSPLTETKDTKFGK